MKTSLKKGTTSKRLAIYVEDTDGLPLTGLVWNSAGLSWYYWREDEGNADGTAVTLATMTRGTWASGGFVEKDATNMPGFYEIGIPNAALTAGAGWFVMVLRGASTMAPVAVEIALVDNTALDIYEAVDDLESRVGTPSDLGGGATLAFNLSDIEAQTDDIGAAGAGLTALATQASVNTIDGIVDNILLDTAEIGTAGAGFTAIPWNASWDAEVQSEVDDALVAQKLDHLVAVADADDVVDNSIIAKLASKGATADWSGFVNTTDALEALRDRGDAAWVTATGFATHSAADVWSVATRVLTANTNLNDPTAAENATAVLTTQMTEAYAANGVAPTLAQAQFAMHQILMQFGISGTSLTVKKLDDSTTAFVVTLDDATTPTAAART